VRPFKSILIFEKSKVVSLFTLFLQSIFTKQLGSHFIHASSCKKRHPTFMNLFDGVLVQHIDIATYVAVTPRARALATRGDVVGDAHELLGAISPLT
jgi:hypothetical protein